MNTIASRVLHYACRSRSTLKPVSICRAYSAGIIPRQSPDTPIESCRVASLPENVVMMGIGEVTEKDGLQRPFQPVTEDCEIVRKALDYPAHMTPPRTWLHSLESEVNPLSAIELHPEVFDCHPRMDFLHQCKEWQEKFKEVDYSWAPTRAEMGRGRKKPWPQKGSGRARHGSRVAPQWKGGGICHGPRGPHALFQKINPTVRIGALTSILTIKFAQNNLLVVNDLSISSPDPGQLDQILSSRGIEDSSALLVFADTDNLDESANIFSAVAELPELNLMPLVAMNVWTLLHHKWLIITLRALEDLEIKVTWNLHRYDWIDKPHNYYRDLPFRVKSTIPEDSFNSCSIPEVSSSS